MCSYADATVDDYGAGGGGTTGPADYGPADYIDSGGGGGGPFGGGGGAPLGDYDTTDYGPGDASDYSEPGTALPDLTAGGARPLPPTPPPCHAARCAPGFVKLRRKACTVSRT